MNLNNKNVTDKFLHGLGKLEKWFPSSYKGFITCIINTRSPGIFERNQGDL